MKTLAFVFCLLSLRLLAQDDIVKNANTFLSMLDASLAAKAQFDFDHAERFNWHFVPKERKGISLHDLSTEQRKAAFALLKSSLGVQGYQKATGIIELENVLREVEGRGPNDTYRDPLNYYFSVFGKPSANGAWGWRLEGHHVSINFSADKGQLVSSTPTFWGSNPGVVSSGEKKGTRVLESEMDLAFSLLNSFSPEQLKTARFSEKALPEILSFNSRKAVPLEPTGILFTAMNKAQQEDLVLLLEVYVKNYQLGFSQKLMDKIKKAGFENLSFAWAGSMKPGAGHYYRIQGPMLLIEYDNTQNNGNHIHTTVRDLTNDFAEDILREHYQKEHGK
jgi:hypothetical protein